jgi:hypothetical protein
MNVVIALGLIALGMCIDAVYQHKIRVAECNAYETGYEQGKNENTIHKEITVPEIQPLPTADNYFVPSMDAPVEMPPTFEERMRKHGRAVVKLK